MQGAFPENADWQAVLDPGVDYQAQLQERSDMIEREMIRITNNRRGPGAGGPLPMDPLLTHTFPAAAPTPHFQLNGSTVYILKDMPESPLRDGIWGHYVVTTVGFGGPPAEARPLLRAVANALPIPAPPGAPGTMPSDLRLRPSPTYCVPIRDYILPTVPASYLEIGIFKLKRALEEAEALDLAFSRRMEGLGNVASQVCWDCLDPDYDPSDRPAVMEQFMGKYLARFYDGIDPESGPPTEDVADEAVHKHKAFCQSWARKHYKTLTPAVTAPAEALASEFYPFLEGRFHPAAKLSRAELARVLMRHPDTAAEFASCLHYYGSSLEQARGGRNASYKQMSTVNAYRAISHKRLGDLLGRKMPELTQLFLDLADQHERWFHPQIVDWHAILGQLPQVHRYFKNSAAVQGLIRRARRNGADAAHVPPWRAGRAQ